MSGSNCEAFSGILQTFRSLGGIADNVRYGHGARGRGLFAIDEALPIRIQVPRSLLFPTASLRLAGGVLTLASAAAIGLLMPIIELCNHSREGAEFGVGPDHVGVTGRFGDGEVLLRYSVADSWQRFIQYGFVSEERPAYSLPMEIRLARGHLVIGHEATSGQPRNGYVVPRMTMEPERITLSYLLLGDRDVLHGPRSIFIAAMRQAGVDQPAIVFDKIAHINRNAFLGLLAAVEDADGAAAAAMRRLARLQLEALSFAVGAREI